MFIRLSILITPRAAILPRTGNNGTVLSAQNYTTVVSLGIGSFYYRFVYSALLLPMLSDFIPESLALGAALALGGIGSALLLAILDKHWAPPMGAVLGFVLGVAGHMLTQ